MYRKFIWNSVDKTRSAKFNVHASFSVGIISSVWGGTGLGREARQTVQLNIIKFRVRGGTRDTAGLKNEETRWESR